jgi:hypothetical protein
MMGVRVVCFVLMVVITPYGWYTWVLGAAAVFLPYIAVVLANVSHAGGDSRAENPERALPASPTPRPDSESHPVLRIEETQSEGPATEGPHGPEAQDDKA